jgi:hypothetical protein
METYLFKKIESKTESEELVRGTRKKMLVKQCMQGHERTHVGIAYRLGRFLTT